MNNLLCLDCDSFFHGDSDTMLCVYCNSENLEYVGESDGPISESNDFEDGHFEGDFFGYPGLHEIED